ncbi:cytochrome-c peroxidase [Thalassotalea euphylliae]|uniref:Cytochrome-c peroxidase n=1 Tax=Thalassotalea euphylliae TaxID=1655234 RepID=A0A3E0U353_9GAMM|nr:cytochrome c peroxidase [Thalassotalea euphylliae]REL31411.1 cytochrome-c peroxidase [Thalassotalea euphylliae]
MSKLLFSLFLHFVFVTSVAIAATENTKLLNTARTYFSPLPKPLLAQNQNTQARIALGKKLYFETALSINNSQSCNTCHRLDNLLENGGAGVDNLKTSIGALGKLGARNAPSTWNSSLHFAQFWDARVKTLVEQATLPIFNPLEMAITSPEQVIRRLEGKGYTKLFEQAFPARADTTNPITMENLAIALADFQRTLISQDRFDTYLKGDEAALNRQEKAGLRLFIEKGCVACHNGPAMGGQLLMKMGIVEPYPNKVDLGRAQVTSNAGDKFFFKVPSMRNVLNTAPYFHDGAATTIEQAIIDTAKHQLGIRLTEQEIQDIKAFFSSLNNQAAFSFNTRQ